MDSWTKPPEQGPTGHAPEPGFENVKYNDPPVMKAFNIEAGRSVSADEGLKGLGM